MSTGPVIIASTGLATGIGLTAEATCAAIRGDIDGFEDTRYLDRSGEWIQGCMVPIESPAAGTRRLAILGAMAIEESLSKLSAPNAGEQVLLLCLADSDRPDQASLDQPAIFDQIRELSGLDFSPHSKIITRGRCGPAVALKLARQLLYDGRSDQVIVAASDSLINRAAISHFESEDRLVTELNSNGFFPGEAGGALVIARPSGDPGETTLLGIGFGMEEATVMSEQPLRADGLTAALNAALQDAGMGESALDFKVTDLSGEQYYFKEASLAFSRIDRTPREEFDIWHPADCLGESGSCSAIAMLSLIHDAFAKGYAPGPTVLAHCADDDGKRSAIVLAKGAN